MEDAIATRHYVDPDGRDVVISIGRPRPHDEGFAVTLAMDGLDEPYRKDLYGSDAVQALQFAILMVMDALVLRHGLAYRREAPTT